MTMQAGSRLQFGVRRRGGTRAYLAVAGGIDTPVQLGAAQRMSGRDWGGLAGGPLRKADRLGSEIARAGARRPCALACTSPPLFRLPTVRVMPGPQVGHFIEEALERLTRGPHRVTSESDRMGYRLEGTALPHRTSADIISEAVSIGRSKCRRTGNRFY